MWGLIWTAGRTGLRQIWPGGCWRNQTMLASFRSTGGVLASVASLLFLHLGLLSQVAQAQSEQDRARARAAQQQQAAAARAAQQRAAQQQAAARAAQQQAAARAAQQQAA